MLPLPLLGGPTEVGIALVPFPLVLWAALSIWMRHRWAGRLYRAWAALYMTTYTGPIVFMRAGDRDFVGSVVVTVGFGAVLVAGDFLLRSILVKDSRGGRAWATTPAWLGREHLPKWQRRVVALLLIAPIALEDLAIAISVLIERRISVDVEARSLAWSMVPAVVVWLGFRMMLLAGRAWSGSAQEQ